MKTSKADCLMPNSWFQFKQFTIQQDKCAMKVTTDACLFGAWAAERVGNSQMTNPTILDIGTGTGLLSLMLAQQCDAVIDAIEIDPAAFEQAWENMEASPWNKNLFVIRGDAKDKVYALGKQYDVIISNPPFYENELKSNNATKNIAHHSQMLSLDELLLLIRQHLAPAGRFYLLLPYKRKEETKKLLDKHSLFIHEAVEISQSTRHNYFRLMIEGGSKKPEAIIYTTIAIQDEQQQYTQAFTALLKDYYLYL